MQGTSRGGEKPAAFQCSTKIYDKARQTGPSFPKQALNLQWPAIGESVCF